MNISFFKINKQLKPNIMFFKSTRPKKDLYSNIEYLYLLTQRNKQFKDLEIILSDAEKYNDRDLIEVRNSLLDNAIKHIENIKSENK